MICNLIFFISLGTNFTSSWIRDYRKTETLDYCTKIIMFILAKCKEHLKHKVQVFIIDEGHNMSTEEWRTTMSAINAVTYFTFIGQ